MQIWMFFLSATIMARDALSLSPPDGYRQERSLPPPPPRPLAKAVPSSARLTPSPVPSPHHFPPPPLMPQQLLPNQCSFGTENSGGNTAGGFADANALYFLANDPAVCTGVIDNLEICFLVTSFTSGSNLHILTFRPQSSGRGVESYIKVDETSFTVTSENLEGAVVECKYLQPENNLYLEEGDVLGFITNQGVRIYLSASNEKDLYQYLPGSKRKRRKRLSVQEAFQVQSVANSDLIPKNATVTPVLKIVMSKCSFDSIYIYLLIMKYFGISSLYLQIPVSRVAQLFLCQQKDQSLIRVPIIKKVEVQSQLLCLLQLL